MVPVKPVPVITTVVPAGPLVGANPLVFGAAALVTVNEVADCAAPAAVATRTLPVVVPVGTVAVIWVAELTV